MYLLRLPTRDSEHISTIGRESDYILHIEP
jgi:hypothetical protein